VNLENAKGAGNGRRDLTRNPERPGREARGRAAGAQRSLPVFARQGLSPMIHGGFGPMERADVIEHIRRSLVVILNRQIPEFSAQTRILEDLEVDSMRFIELLVSLEDTLGLEVDPDTFEPEIFQSVGAFADYIVNRLASVAA
jgi:acyl carrier protein